MHHLLPWRKKLQRFLSIPPFFVELRAAKKFNYDQCSSTIYYPLSIRSCSSRCCCCRCPISAGALRRMGRRTIVEWGYKSAPVSNTGSNFFVFPFSFVVLVFHLLSRRYSLWIGCCEWTVDVVARTGQLNMYLRVIIYPHP